MENYNKKMDSLFPFIFFFRKTLKYKAIRTITAKHAAAITMATTTPVETPRWFLPTVQKPS